MTRQPANRVYGRRPSNFSPSHPNDFAVDGYMRRIGIEARPSRSGQ